MIATTLLIGFYKIKQAQKSIIQNAKVVNYLLRLKLITKFEKAIATTLSTNFINNKTKVETKSKNQSILLRLYR